MFTMGTNTAPCMKMICSYDYKKMVLCVSLVCRDGGAISSPVAIHADAAFVQRSARDALALWSRAETFAEAACKRARISKSQEAQDAKNRNHLGQPGNPA